MRTVTTLTEKYRPRRLEQMVGQDGAIRKIKRILDREAFDGGSFLIEGASGTGKTCLAHCIAGRLGVSRDGWNYVELDGDRCSVDQVRALDDQTHAAGLFSDCWRIVVVNESHLMTHKAVGAWLTLLERLPYRWVVIFTTTESSAGLFGPMGKPFADRSTVIVLSNQGLSKPFARLARAIARREGLDGKPVSTYENAIRREGVKNSLRALLQRIQAGDFLD